MWVLASNYLVRSFGHCHMNKDLGGVQSTVTLERWSVVGLKRITAWMLQCHLKQYGSVLTRATLVGVSVYALMQTCYVAASKTFMITMCTYT